MTELGLLFDNDASKTIEVHLDIKILGAINVKCIKEIYACLLKHHADQIMYPAELM
jgi:hypothetical protein